MKFTFSKVIYRSSFIALIYLLLSYAVPSLLFFANMEINRLYFPLFVIVAISLGCILIKGDIKEKIISIFIFGAVVTISIVVSMYVFDTTFDGNTYHKAAVGFLQHGWNPVYQRADAFNESSSIDLMGFSTYSIWIDHYGNSSWVMASVISCFFACIETGKAINLIASFSLFGILNFYLSQRYLNNVMSFLISAVTVLNPITICQFTNYYLDGSLMMYLFIGILALFILSDENSPIQRNVAVIMLCASIALCGNIKFTGLAYIAIFCIGFEVLWLYRAWKKDCFKQVFVKSMTFFVCVVIFSYGILGFPSFIQNIIETGEPLYPVIGEHSVELVSTHEAVEFQGKNNIQKFIMSTFCNVSNTMAGHIEPKTWDGIVNNIKNGIIGPDTRFSGYGPVFHVILIVSVLICIIGTIMLWKKDKNRAGEIALVLGLTTALLICIQGSWYARYSPHEYLFVIFALIYLGILKPAKRFSKIGIWICRWALIGVIAINLYPFIYTPYVDLRMAKGIHAGFDRVEELQQTNENGIVYFKEYGYTGILFNFVDRGLYYSGFEVGEPTNADNLIDIYPEIYNRIWYDAQ